MLKAQDQWVLTLGSLLHTTCIKYNMSIIWLIVDTYPQHVDAFDMLAAHVEQNAGDRHDLLSKPTL